MANSGRTSNSARKRRDSPRTNSTVSTLGAVTGCRARSRMARSSQSWMRSSRTSFQKASSPKRRRRRCRGALPGRNPGMRSSWLSARRNCSSLARMASLGTATSSRTRVPSRSTWMFSSLTVLPALYWLTTRGRKAGPNRVR